MTDSHTLSRLASVAVFGLVAITLFVSAFSPAPSIYAG